MFYYTGILIGYIPFTNITVTCVSFASVSFLHVLMHVRHYKW